MVSGNKCRLYIAIAGTIGYFFFRGSFLNNNVETKIVYYYWLFTFYSAQFALQYIHTFCSGFRILRSSYLHTTFNDII